MRAFLKTAIVAVLAIGFAGCASSAGSSGMPCASCKYGVSEKKADAPMHYCVLDGKKLDCRTNPAGCPECAKASR